MRHSADATIPDNDPDDDTRIGTTPLGYSKGNMRNLLKELMSKKSDGQTNESASKNKASSTETKSVVQKVAENEKSVENEVDSEQYHEDNIEKPENSEDKKSFDFFISYCHANKDLVNQIDEGLSKKDPNLKIWRDIRETSGGQALGAEIVQGIKNCRVFLAMFSSEYLQSDPCMRENSLADAHRYFFLLVRPLNICIEIKSKQFKDEKMLQHFFWHAIKRLICVSYSKNGF